MKEEKEINRFTQKTKGDIVRSYQTKHERLKRGRKFYVQQRSKQMEKDY